MGLFTSRKLKIIKPANISDLPNLVLAFEWHKKKYYQLEDAFKIPTGRALCAITFYEEFRMRCDKEYLDKHCRAIDILISDPKKIMIGEIAWLHKNLKERVQLAPYPDHIYKLASVLFFDESESPYSYDYKYNVDKIKEWKEDPELLSFLVSQPLKELMSFGELAGPSVQTFLLLKEQENQEHLRKLDEILLKEP